MGIDLKIGQTDPVVETCAVIEFADFLLGILSSHYIYHVWNNVDFGFILFIDFLVQTL